MSVDPNAALPRRPSPGAAGAQLGRLYADHSRMVYGICRMLLRDPDEAEDATQQVFLAAYSNLLTGTTVRDPAAWLGTIARNACRRRSATRMREPLAVADDEITVVSPGVEEAAIGREEASALYAELGRLPDKQREAVVLRDLYGLRYDEVAKALGTSRPAVEALLFRGRRRLQRRLRPGVAAGVLVVPLAVQESIAYAVPGFAGAAAPVGAAVTAAGVPLLAKLAAGGAAVGLAGSAGLVAERALHDPPARPADSVVRSSTTPVQAAVARSPAPSAASARTTGPVSAPVAAEGGDDGGAGHRGSSGEGDNGPARAAGLAPGGDDDAPDDGPRGAAGHEGDDEDVHRAVVDDAEDSGSSRGSSGSGSSGRSGEVEDHSEPDEADAPDEPDESETHDELEG